MAQKYDKITGIREKLGLIKGDAASIKEYVTAKTLDGLYLMISEEEHAIRTDIPRLHESAIVTKVFDALRSKAARNTLAGSRDTAGSR